MARTSAPEWVTSQLQPGEVVLARLGASSVDYYATDRRLLRFRGTRDYEALPYESLTVSRKGLGRVMEACRVLLVALGLACVAAAILFGERGLTFTTATTFYDTKMPAMVEYLFAAIGLISLLAAILVGDCQYEIAVLDPQGRIRRKWRLQTTRWGSGEVHDLAAVLEERTE